MMKIYLIIAFLLSSVLSFAQNPVPKKVNTIIITDTLSGADALKKLSLLLQDKGFTIDKSDKELLSITTGPKPIKMCSVILNIYKRDKQIFITGSFDAGVVSGMTIKDKISNTGMKGSMANNAWNEMNNLALAYGGSKIEYQIK
jgi:hypothetical protein